MPGGSEIIELCKAYPVALLFAIIACSALGVSVTVGFTLASNQGDLSQYSQSIVYLFLFNGVWTFFAAIFSCGLRFCWKSGRARVISANIWLIITIILWAVALGLLLKECPDNINPFNTCVNLGVIPVVPVLGWIVLGLCILTLLAIWIIGVESTERPTNSVTFERPEIHYMDRVELDARYSQIIRVAGNQHNHNYRATPERQIPVPDTAVIHSDTVYACRMQSMEVPARNYVSGRM